MKCGYHGRVVLRGDGELALQDVLNEVARLRGDAPTVLETSPYGDSQSNGYIERAIRSIEEMIRAHKLDLEAKLGTKIAVTSNVVAWLVEHSADVLNKCQVGRDRRTPYERLKGKRLKGTMCEFASPCMLRVTGKPQGGLMQPRWLEGLWLGSRFNSQEHLVARYDDGVVVRARAIREVPRKVTPGDLDRIQGVPHAPAGVQHYKRPEHSAEVPQTRIPDVPPQLPGSGLDSRSVPRSVRTIKEVVDKFGPTPRCGKCRSVLRGETTTLGHSKECRVRIEELLKADDQYQHKLQEAELRKSQYLAEEVERGETQVGQAHSQAGEASANASSTSQANVESRGSSSSIDVPDASVSKEDAHRGGEKRKAADELPEDLERCNRSEIPIPSADGDIPMTEDCTASSADEERAGSFKRPLDQDHEEPLATRMRVDMLCLSTHGAMGAQEMDAAETDIRNLVCSTLGVVVQRDEHLEDHVGHAGDVPWERMWEPWWERAGNENIPEGSSAEAVKVAKKAELESFAKHKVYEVVPRSELDQNPEAIMLSTKWVVTNKGSKEKPIAKARLVAREFVSKAIDRDALFAGTPGLSVMRALVSRAATTSSRSPRRRIMLMDVKTAFLYGKCVWPLFMEVPEGDPDHGNPQMVARLLQSLYGTRDAPQRWAEHLAQSLQGLGFV